MRRKDILYVDPSSDLIVSTDFSSSGEGTFTFEEQYRGPEELRGHSYDLTLPYSEVPVLGAFLVGRFGLEVLGDPAEQLVHCLEELITRGELSPAGGGSALRDQVFAWCEEAGLAPRRGGLDRHEVLLARGEASVELTLNSNNRQISFQECHGPVADRSGLYQLHLGHTTLDALIEVLEGRSLGPTPPEEVPGKGRPDVGLSRDDRLFAAFRAVAARGELELDEPGAVRDRVAGWLAAAGVTFQSYGSEWKTTLLKVHRQRNDCIFALRMTFDPERGAEGIRFTESYDYLPLADDPGREYTYTVQAPYDCLPALIAYFDQRLGRTSTGSPQARLIDCFTALITRGDLGDNLPLRENHLRVGTWFEAAGAPTTTDTWSWLNSD